MKSISRSPDSPPDPKYLWRCMGPEERAILKDNPGQYGRTISELKELAKTTKLRKNRCMQMSTSKEEARGWCNEGGGLIRVSRDKLCDSDWEQVADHHFVFVTGDAIARLHEFVDE